MLNNISNILVKKNERFYNQKKFGGSDLIKYILLLTALCKCLFLNGEIFEVSSIYSLQKYIDHKTLIVFDIDNTLMETEQTLGSDQWFYYRWNQLLTEGFPAKEAKIQALKEWISIQNISKVKVVEEGTKEFVQKLQNENYTIIGLTTRGLEMSFTTVTQLESLGIMLNTTSPFKDDLFFKNRNKGVYYHQGILFTMATPKGDALYTLLTIIDLRPDKIVFINDKKEHLKDVEKMCIEKNIPYIGLRYNYLDHKIQNFDKNIAEIQFDKYGKFLSDEEASNLINHE